MSVGESTKTSQPQELLALSRQQKIGVGTAPGLAGGGGTEGSSPASGVTTISLQPGDVTP